MNEINIKKNEHIRQYIRSTAQRPGAILAFARLAAAPPYVTCDLLYRLWQHFGEALDLEGKKYAMDYMVVSDLLNTAIFKEIGWDLYEMDADLRPFFQQELEMLYPKAVLLRIAQFIEEYATVSFFGQENQYMREAQLFTAKAILNPEALIKEMGEKLEHAIQNQNTDTVYHLFLNLERLADNTLLHQADRQTYSDMATVAIAEVPHSGTSPRLVITDNLDEPGIEITLTPRMRQQLGIQFAQSAAASTENKPPSFKDDLAGEFVLVESGTFQMGGNDYDSEKPIHAVTMPDFYMGKYPVTVKEYLVFCEATNSNFPEWLEEGNQYHLKTGSDDHYKKKGYEEANRDKLPIVGISWHDAQAYCTWLNEKTGQNYRLPSEAEWEYAVRGGKKSKGYKYAGSNNIDEVAWYDKNSNSKPQFVGQKKPNELGLYDMSGNVWEWCEDIWHENYSGAPEDGTAWLTDGDDSRRVLRGGSWSSSGLKCRVAIRSRGYPAGRYSNGGFRLARGI